VVAGPPPDGPPSGTEVHRVSPLFVLLPLLLLVGGGLLVAIVVGLIRWGGRRARQDVLDAQPPPPGHPYAATWQPPRRRTWVFDNGHDRYLLVFWPVPVTRARAQQILGRSYTIVFALLVAAVAFIVVGGLITGAG
jgi:hypothetical protein